MQRECTDENNPAKIEANKTETEDAGELARSFHVIMLRTYLEHGPWQPVVYPKPGRPAEHHKAHGWPSSSGQINGQSVLQLQTRCR